MITAWPKNLPGPGTSAAWLGDQITKMSDGKLTVRVHGASNWPPPRVFEAVSQGAAEMYHAVPTYWRSKSPVSCCSATCHSD